MALSATIKVTNPVGDSDLCGVSTARKAPGSACVCSDLSAMSHPSNLKGPREAPMPKTLRPRPPAMAVKRAPARSRTKSTSDRVAEIFRRFAEAKGELEYANPFTLLVAVVLSAQATDAGVNKATEPLFKVADTPQKMLKLGEEACRS